MQRTYYFGCRQLAFLESVVEGTSPWWAMAVLKAELSREAGTPLEVGPLPGVGLGELGTL